MPKTVLLIDDSEDIRELLTFILSEVGDFEYQQAANVKEAQSLLMTKKDFDLVVSDFNLPDGKGSDIYAKYQELKIKCPFIFVSGETLEAHPLVASQKIPLIKKPFSVVEVQNTLLKLLKADAHLPKYIPVSLRLLELIKNVKTPLYIRINEEKFVQMTPAECIFDLEQVTRFKLKGVEHLYILQNTSEDFISEYRKKTFSQMAWDETQISTLPEHLSTHMEFLRKFSQELGLREDVAVAASTNIQKVLQIAQKNSKLSPLLQLFHKIDRWGNSDHSSLLVILCHAILDKTPLMGPLAQRSLTFASMIHDVTLTDEEYHSKQKNIKRLQAQPNIESADLKKLKQHPAVASEICKTWDYCPEEAARIIFEHHELPDGTGFPMGRKASEIHPLSALFIVAEDFTHFYMESFGKPDLQQYFQTRSKTYTESPFKEAFGGLAKALQTNS